LAKRAYEKVLAQAGSTTKHYHADNGCFSDKGVHLDITDKGQFITFCRVLVRIIRMGILKTGISSLL
jgi:hypothetical protein